MRRKRFRRRNGRSISLRIREPLFDPLRSDPRYIETVKRVGLPP
jgi:hypothetical protein